jgi:hypothetical protein
VVALLVMIWVAVAGMVRLTELRRDGGGLAPRPAESGQLAMKRPVMEEMS